MRKETQQIRQVWQEVVAASEFRDRVDREGKPVPPTSEFVSLLESFLRLFQGWMQPIARDAVAELERAYKKVQAAEALFDNSFIARSYDSFWAMFWESFDAVAAKMFLEVPPLHWSRLPTKPHEAHEQKVSDKQIALSWNWFEVLTNGDRVPDEARVRREIANPGSELTEQEIEKFWRAGLIAAGWILEDSELPPGMAAPPAPATPATTKRRGRPGKKQQAREALNS